MTYDPNQPRDPAGSATGGEWTGGQLDAIERSARKAAGLSESQFDSVAFNAKRRLDTAKLEALINDAGVKTDSVSLAGGMPLIKTSSRVAADKAAGLLRAAGFPNIQVKETVEFMRESSKDIYGKYIKKYLTFQAGRG